jgi:hypothetical protein
VQGQLQPSNGVQPSIVDVHRTSVGGLALTLVLLLAPAVTASASPVLTLREDGSAYAREDPYLPPDAATAPRTAPAPRTATAPPRLAARAAAARRRTVRRELARMLAAAAIDRRTHDRLRRVYADAARTRSRLRGARAVGLGAALRNLDAIAASGQLTVSRLPALFETVARNREWWSRGPLLGSGQRVSFRGSRLVWQHYPGEGLQIQWLGTFGKANGLWQSRRHDRELRELLDEALGLAAERAGGIAFEYLFRFGGGRPPWVSGLAQGTAVQALSRGAVRLGEPRYFQAARAGLGVFRTAPPAGVRVSTPAGAHYVIYSYAPGLRVLNGFTQALVGLHDFAALANDDEGRALFAAGEAQLRRELPLYDTGGWSRYSLSRDADVHYHTLARDFLRNLCRRLTDARRRPQDAPAAPTGGAGPVPGAPPAPVADPGPYCDAAQRFTRYLSTPPRARIVSERGRAGKPISIRVRLDKPAFVTLGLRRAGRTVAVLRARLPSGRSSLRWTSPPRRGGEFEVRLTATDLTGNRGEASGELRVLRPRSKR